LRRRQRVGRRQPTDERHVVAGALKMHGHGAFNLQDARYAAVVCVKIGGAHG